MKITEENLIELATQFDRLKDHPCCTCSNEYCDICLEARAWITNVIPVIDSPLLDYVITEFIVNHSLSQTKIEKEEQT